MIKKKTKGRNTEKRGEKKRGTVRNKNVETEGKRVGKGEKSRKCGNGRK